VRSGPWKLIQYLEGGTELYDLNENISESNDLAAEMPQKSAELLKKLETWRKSVNAQMPTARK